MELNFFPLQIRFIHIRFPHVKLLSSWCQILQRFSSQKSMNVRFETWAWIYLFECIIGSRERKIVTKLNERKTQALKVSQSVLFPQTQVSLYQRYQEMESKGVKHKSEQKPNTKTPGRRETWFLRHLSLSLSLPFKAGLEVRRLSPSILIRFLSFTFSIHTKIKQNSYKNHTKNHSNRD